MRKLHDGSQIDCYLGVISNTRRMMIVTADAIPPRIAIKITARTTGAVTLRAENVYHTLSTAVAV
jgi:hypothetical protein